MTELRHAGTLVLETPRRTHTGESRDSRDPRLRGGWLLRGVHTGLAAFCEAVPYASTATVASATPRTDCPPDAGSGFVVPRVERSALLAGTWVTSKWPGRAPEGHVLLRGFLGGGQRSASARSQRRGADRTAREELEDLLGITGEPILSRACSGGPARVRSMRSAISQRVAAIERSPRRDSPAVRHRQRLPRHRHP